VRILILGPQGSGKGTQAKRIAAEYEVPHVSTGDMFRDHKARGTELGKKAQARLEKMGVEIQLNAMVTDVDRNGLTVKDPDGTTRRIECATKVWSAGVSASALGRDLAGQSDVEIDKAGRVKVLPDLSIPGYPNVFVVGDMAAVEGVPGMAQGAIQGGKYVATAIKSELKGADPLEREPFEYFDKGSMATIGRNKAVAEFVQAQWKQNLGITVPIKNMEFRTFLPLLNKVDYEGFARRGWVGDYMDPYTFLDLLSFVANHAPDAATAGRDFTSADLVEFRQG
jgi:hypothetical protein